MTSRKFAYKYVVATWLFVDLLTIIHCLLQFLCNRHDFLVIYGIEQNHRQTCYLWPIFVFRCEIECCRLIGNFNYHYLSHTHTNTFSELFLNSVADIYLINSAEIHRKTLLHLFNCSDLSSIARKSRNSQKSSFRTKRKNIAKIQL